MIELTNVSYAYATRQMENSVQNINLKIEDGEAVLICGESGCGKTTMLRLLNGLIPHYYEGELSGSIALDGKDMSAMELHDISFRVGSVCKFRLT